MSELSRIVEKIRIQWLAGQQLRRASFNVDDEFVLHIYFYSDSQNPPDMFTADRQLLDESHHQNIGSGYSIRFDRSHAYVDPNRDHIHVYKKGNHLAAVNRDGSGHDGHHGKRIPSKVADFISREFPDFELPDDNILEWCELEQQAMIIRLLENK